jgi:hypothetical protein
VRALGRNQRPKKGKQKNFILFSTKMTKIPQYYTSLIKPSQQTSF